MSVLMTLHLAEPRSAEEVRRSGLDEDAVLDEPEVDLGRSWHVLHYLLNGSVEPDEGPLGQALLGGIGIDGETRYHPADAVRSIAAALVDLDDAAVAGRFDPVAMAAAGVYDAPREGDDPTPWLDLHAELGNCFGEAARRGLGVLVVHG